MRSYTYTSIHMIWIHVCDIELRKVLSSIIMPSLLHYVLHTDPLVHECDEGIGRKAKEREKEREKEGIRRAGKRRQKSRMLLGIRSDDCSKRDLTLLRSWLFIYIGIDPERIVNGKQTYRDRIRGNIRRMVQWTIRKSSTDGLCEMLVDEKRRQCKNVVQALHTVFWRNKYYEDLANRITGITNEFYFTIQIRMNNNEQKLLPKLD